MINSTLIAQIIHFFIAWWMLRRFMWPQLLTAYEAHTQKQLMLEHEVKLAEERVREQKERLDAEWSTVRRTCRRMLAPVQEQPSILAVPPLELPQPLDADIVDTLAQKSAQALTSKVLDA